MSSRIDSAGTVQVQPAPPLHNVLTVGQALFGLSIHKVLVWLFPLAKLISRYCFTSRELSGQVHTEHFPLIWSRGSVDSRYGSNTALHPHQTMEQTPDSDDLLDLGWRHGPLQRGAGSQGPSHGWRGAAPCMEVLPVLVVPFWRGRDVDFSWASDVRILFCALHIWARISSPYWRSLLDAFSISCQIRGRFLALPSF